MFRFILILFLCAIFVACSSDDSAALDKWFNDQGIASSYGMQFSSIDIPVDSFALGRDSSAHMVSSYAALGNVNGMENILYFGLKVSGSLQDVWKLRTYDTFYTEIHKDIVPAEQKKELDATIYWLVENRTEHDATWLRFIQLKPLIDFDSAQTKIKWDSDGAKHGTFLVSMPPKLLELKADTLRLLVGIRLSNSNTVLRIDPPTILDIRGLQRVAQKTNILESERENCEYCLHAGIRESLNVSFEIKDKIMAGKTVMFAQLLFLKKDAAGGNELGHPVPVYVYSKLDSVGGYPARQALKDYIPEDYIVDTAFVKNYGHPNLIFWKSDSDTLKLQVTKSLRHYASAADSLPDILDFTLKLGAPMLDPKSFCFYNYSNSNRCPEKVFFEGATYSKYDFSSLKKGEEIKLRLWYADYGNDK